VLHVHGISKTYHLGEVDVYALRKVDLDLVAGVKQLVDSKLRRIDMPPAGLVLTRKLAQTLGAHPGDLIDVEQLEGRRRQFSEPLIALSDEPLGISGYMDSRALSRVLGEDGEVSGALLEIDRSRQGELYETLERTPVVAAVAIRAAMLQSIRDTMNRSFILMTIVMTAFAAVLVVAVVYNSARIALSERGNELASLGVLGFSNAEVTLLLLGEQAILTLVAIPVGFGLGIAICRMLIPVFDRELFRLPFVLTAATFGFAALVTLVSAVLSGFLVMRRILGLDLIAVLESRE
jgi:putative ABC transport system permease protein